MFNIKTVSSPNQQTLFHDDFAVRIKMNSQTKDQILTESIQMYWNYWNSNLNQIKS